jgi:hypothetical protein
MSAQSTTHHTPEIITVPCELCAVEYDVSTMTEYVCRRCKITICDTCKVRDKAIGFCDPCQMEVCADCDELGTCDECHEDVCTSCGGTTLCDDCDWVVCAECVGDHEC